MTYEVRHSFFINASVETVMAALMREEDIQKWWTNEAQVMNGKGSFSWSGHGWHVELDMEQHIESRQVIWTCIKSNMQNTHAWEGTTIRFLLIPHTDGTQVKFSQTDYKDSPCFEACDQGWAYFVGTSLKQYIETGVGVPYPEKQDTSPN